MLRRNKLKIFVFTVFALRVTKVKVLTSSGWIVPGSCWFLDLFQLDSHVVDISVDGYQIHVAVLLWSCPLIDSISPGLPTDQAPYAMGPTVSPVAAAVSNCWPPSVPKNAAEALMLGWWPLWGLVLFILFLFAVFGLFWGAGGPGGWSPPSERWRG